MAELIKPINYKPNDKCNGCGSGWNASIIPDSIYFMDIRKACCIHDYMYEIGTTETEKKIADTVFELNMYRLIDADKNWFRNNKFMKNRMKKIADIYSHFVREFGHDAFWKGKK